LGQTIAGSIGNDFAFVAPELDRTDAENQKRLRRPLNQGRSRTSGKRSVVLTKVKAKGAEKAATPGAVFV
jgi:hypothetical protein